MFAATADRLNDIVPANNSVIEPEFRSALWPGVAAYAKRVSSPRVHSVRELSGELD